MDLSLIARIAITLKIFPISRLVGDICIMMPALESEARSLLAGPENEVFDAIHVMCCTCACSDRLLPLSPGVLLSKKSV